MDSYSSLPKLDDKKEDIDITDELFESLKKISDHRVVQSELFNLLEGTRALEMNNIKLDTGLVQLSEEDVKFDTLKPQDIENVVGIIEKLLRSFSSWLDNSSLQVTVLSCRYVQSLLTNYRKAPELRQTLSNCIFKIDRFDVQADYDINTKEYKLINKILRSIVIGLCKFIGFCLYVANNVLYEEEDLTTRSMDFNFLADVSVDLVLSDIKDSIQWVKNNIDGNYRHTLVNFLELVHRMVQIQTVLNISIDLFGRNSNTSQKIGFLKDAIENIKYLSLNKSNDVPVGSFSKFIQLDEDNRNIPAELYEISLDESYRSLESMFSKIIDYVTDLGSIKNLNQLQNFLRYNISYQIDNNFNVIARGIFQLFFIRDDRSIVGSAENISSLSLKLIEGLVGVNTAILNPDQWNIQGNDEFIQQTQTDVLQKLNILLGDFDTSAYHNFTTAANNRCRQRQLNSKSLLIWDTLQVSFENLEVSLWDSYKIGNQLKNEEMGLSISSYIFYIKLELMIEVALSGFELEIYKGFEACLIFWYASYLSQVLVEHIATRVNSLIESKIHQILVAVPKKLKKIKAGPKKNKLKELHQHNTEVFLPQLQKTLEYNNNHLIKKYDTLYALTDAIRMYLILLSSLKFVDFNNPKYLATSPELLYNLRMKPWSSIGVPELPTFSQYKRSIEIDFLDSSAKQLAVIKVICGKLNFCEAEYRKIKDSLTDSNISDQFLGTNVHEQYESLISTCEAYRSQLNKLETLVLNSDISLTHPTHKVVFEAQSHKYFPMISVKQLT